MVHWNQLEQALPQRGDEFDVWLRRQRDKFPRGSYSWNVVDQVLDEYRLHADTGTALGDHACDYHCDCERE